ncbi:MAG TPA: amidohydrolase family protein [Bacteroidota bacterium]|nr:amidohydrolase family protein [Bacteroidota bacterium]
MKIDSHQHFWNYDKREYGWISESMSVLATDRLPEHLAPELQSLGFDGSVAVQARQSAEETAWLLSLADRYEWIKGVVGWVDLRAVDADEKLKTFARHPKLVGVRHVVQDEPDDAFILRPEFLRGIGLLKKYDLAYDILIFPKQLSNTISMVEKFPEQRFILDHCAKPCIREHGLALWAEDLTRLGRYTNVYCKVSGLVTEADWRNWTPADFTAYLDVVMGAFGADRVMIGSDWPVCTVAGSYAAVMGIVTGYLNSLSADEQAAVLGGNAARAYHL